MGIFRNIFFFNPHPFQMGSTLTANFGQMLMSDPGKLHQVITSHIGSIHVKYECFLPGRYIVH